MALFVSTYFGVAAAVAGYAFYHGVLLRRPHPLLGGAENATLLLVSLAVGAIWFVFLPVAIARIAPPLWRSLDTRLQDAWIPAAKALRFRG
jgi:hypothetical protein